MRNNNSNHHIWQRVKYTNINILPKEISKSRITPQPDFLGTVEIRDLPAGHPCCGEQGLFAAQVFETFDIIGCYNGKYVDADERGFPNMKLIKSGHYLARFDNLDLGIDSMEFGNEMRCINSYLNIAESPNCVMRTTYVESLPQIFIICTKPIQIGEEILLDYGEAYNTSYLLPKSFQSKEIPTEKLFEELAFVEDGDDCQVV